MKASGEVTETSCGCKVLDFLKCCQQGQKNKEIQQRGPIGSIYWQDTLSAVKGRRIQKPSGKKGSRKNVARQFVG
jgi:hypothetical protein